MFRRCKLILFPKIKHVLGVADLQDGDLFGTPITLLFSLFEVVVHRGVNLCF